MPILIDGRCADNFFGDYFNVEDAICMPPSISKTESVLRYAEEFPSPYSLKEIRVRDDDESFLVA